MKKIEDMNPQEINEMGDRLGKKIVENQVTTNQLRNVFSHVALIRQKFRNKGAYAEDIERKLVLLKPQLAYAKGKKSELKEFQEFMFEAIDGVTNADKTKKEEALENFLALIESVVAYHKFYGGK